MRLDSRGAAVETRLTAMANAAMARRIWAKDHPLWKPDPTEISNRLGWLTTLDGCRWRRCWTWALPAGRREVRCR